MIKLSRPPRRPQGETIIALIDVVFFLLVFFMLIGRMDATAPFELRPATAQSGADMPAGGATIAVSADGTLALDGRATGRSAAIATLKARLAGDPELRIRINAHRDARLQEVLPLVARIEALGARDVMLVVTPESF